MPYNKLFFLLLGLLVFSCKNKPVVPLPKMVLIKAGSFDMGQPNHDIKGKGWTKDEQPVHRVFIRDFYINMTANL